MKRKLAPPELDTDDLEKKFNDYLRNEKNITDQQYENITKNSGVNLASALHFMEFQEKHPEYFFREIKPIHYEEYLKNYFDEPMVFVELSNYNKQTNESLSKEEFIVTKMFLHLLVQIKENKLIENKDLYVLIKEHNINAHRFLYSLKGRKIEVSIYLFGDVFFKFLPEFKNDYNINECFK